MIGSIKPTFVGQEVYLLCMCAFVLQLLNKLKNCILPFLAAFPCTLHLKTRETKVSLVVDVATAICVAVLVVTLLTLILVVITVVQRC